ncbi:hypothetical protein [Amphritea balenae]|uniref:Exonuclease domain-containing protein n=1 Tax=Amphritea balenae TaxID=452629 RepID=A0A3P1SY15_9GAMM|nr:hypothetical protein [Amphritea balenae]RRD01003.1 hypothetical protein EHS89_00075 [Amphritea balenae]GGK60838.1 hypothetical protein GCM10007941_08810 [Amphritea balenae]
MDLICLDIEASGLGPRSYPIEVAWKSLAGASDNFLIDPCSADEWDYWDDFAEEMHGICRSELLRDGVDVHTACDRMNAALADKLVLSDAWEFDYFWLQRLFQATGKAMTFKLQGLESVLQREELIQYQFICKAQLRRHRAMSDVDHILQAIRSVKFDL